MLNDAGDSSECSVYAEHAIVETELEAYRQPGILAWHAS
jgi:hypothetical protein